MDPTWAGVQGRFPGRCDVLILGYRKLTRLVLARGKPFSLLARDRWRKLRIYQGTENRNSWWRERDDEWEKLSISVGEKREQKKILYEMQCAPYSIRFETWQLFELSPPLIPHNSVLTVSFTYSHSSPFPYDPLESPCPPMNRLLAATLLAPGVSLLKSILITTRFTLFLKTYLIMLLL